MHGGKMLTHTCLKCGRVLPVGKKCECMKRVYSVPTGTRKGYHTNRWRRLRESVMNAYGYKDLVAASEGRLEPAETVHHIVPTSDDPSQFYSFENLIPVSRHTHDAIHDRYRESEQAKRDEQARLRDILQVYRETH